MKRRNFLGAALLVPVLAKFSPALSEIEVPVYPGQNTDENPQSGDTGVSWFDSIDPFLPKKEYRGFKIKWRGWFPITNMDAQVGQWIAYNPRMFEGRYFHVYSSCPGAVDKFYGDMIFDTAMRKGQEFPKHPETLGQLNRCKEQTYKRLIKYIDEHYEELTRG